jgi:hypothetical protein
VPPAGRRLMATPPPAAEQSPGARLPSPVEWTSNRSATRPDPLHPMHRHDVGRARAPDRTELEHVAIAMRQKRKRSSRNTQPTMPGSGTRLATTALVGFQAVKGPYGRTARWPSPARSSRSSSQRSSASSLKRRYRPSWTCGIRPARAWAQTQSFVTPRRSATSSTVSRRVMPLKPLSTALGQRPHASAAVRSVNDRRSRARGRNR